MNILWDFRLFSFGYGSRGVGRYVNAVASAVAQRFPADWKIVAWGDRNCVPEPVASHVHRWVRYRPGTWKSDLLAVPLCALGNRARILHHWVALGPVPRLGLGVVNGPRTLATVYDLGVEYWRGVPFLNHIATTPYWRIQKSLFRGIGSVVTCSVSTRHEVERLGGPGKNFHVAYPPLGAPPGVTGRRCAEPLFVALGGSPTKNLALAVEAFSRFRSRNPGHELVVLGDVNVMEEVGRELPEGVRRDAMERFTDYLGRATAFVSCSTHEGLGIPPLEAARVGSPLILSDIPAHRETCDGGALFVSPTDPQDCAAKMAMVAQNLHEWEAKAQVTFERYEARAEESVAKLVEFYGSLL